MVVDWHGCHTALYFGVKVKENKTKFLLCTGYLNSIKPPIKQHLLLILVLVRQQNFLAAAKMLSSYERSDKNLFWSIKNSGEILDKRKAREIQCDQFVYL